MMTLPQRDAIVIFESELSDIRKACLENVISLTKKYSPYKELNIEMPITEEGIHQHLNYIRVQNEAAPLLKLVRRIDSYRLAQDNPNAEAFRVTDIDIDNARCASEDWFVYQAELSTRKPHKGVCPFHDDKDPSLMLMTSKKTGHHYLKCFVCNEAWDAIGYIMKRENTDFISAVKIVIS